MPPARRKGYTYTEQPAVGTAAGTWALIRNRDGQGLGSFATNPELYAAVEADRALEPERAPAYDEFLRTHVDEKGPDLRTVAEDELVPDGCRRTGPGIR